MQKKKILKNKNHNQFVRRLSTVKKMEILKNLLERSTLSSGWSNNAFSGESSENLTVPNPATFNCPPLSSKIFLAPYRNFVY
jgi:hypothetical protein